MAFIYSGPAAGPAYKHTRAGTVHATVAREGRP
jgi:hypothetical protein